MAESKALQDIKAFAEQSKLTRSLLAIMHKREAYFNASDCELEKLRRHYFHTYPEARVRTIEKWGVVMDAPTLKRVPLPPKGYAYKGGAARIALSQTLGSEPLRQTARDLDLIRIAARSDQIDRSVAKKIMQEDAKHGAGIECVPDYETYLRTRDITINEVLYCGDTVVASHEAVDDFANRVIRTTEHAASQSPESLNRIVAKVVRFATEYSLAGNPAEEVYYPETDKLFLFSFLLQLDRSLSSSARLADMYCQEVARRGLMPSELGNISSLQELSSARKAIPKKLQKQFPLLFRTNSSATKQKKSLRL